MGLEDKVVDATLFLLAFRLLTLVVFVNLPLAAELHGLYLNENRWHAMTFRLRLAPFTQSFLDLRIVCVVLGAQELSDPILPFLGSATCSTSPTIIIVVVSIIGVCSRVCSRSLASL